MKKIILIVSLVGLFLFGINTKASSPMSIGEINFRTRYYNNIEFLIIQNTQHFQVINLTKEKLEIQKLKLEIQKLKK